MKNLRLTVSDVQTGKNVKNAFRCQYKYFAKKNIENLIRKIAGARGGTRTPTPGWATDFKSVASTIPPHGHYVYSITFKI